MRRGRTGDDSGSMLIELIVSLVIFALLSIGLLGLSLTTTKSVATNRDREVATQLAAKDLEVVRSNTITNLVPGRTTSTVVQGGQTYTIDHDANFVTLGAAGSACGSAGAPSYYRITAIVTWKNMGTAKPVTAETLVTPAVGIYDQTDGNYGIKILDRDAKPKSGVTVTISGPSSASQVTGADGCAFFAFKNPGTYTAVLSAAGFVDPVGATSPSSSQSVASGGTANTQFNYDNAAKIKFDINTTSTYPAPSTVPFTVYNTSFTNTTKTRSQTVGAGPLGPYYSGSASALQNASMTGLFPSLSGYVPWAGTCLDADPGASRQAAVAVSPGGTSTAAATNVARYTITVNGLSATKGWTLTASHASDGSCASGESYAVVPTGSIALAPSMAYSGSLPFGTWTFTAKNVFTNRTATVNVTWPGSTTTVQTVAVTIT